ncbi:MAG: pyridoxal-5'-phosphate-dependent protein [Campylobacter sp.]|nr:pyridoxal-5'-phosphate-dependent protein [Campylobacter sp.]
MPAKVFLSDDLLSLIDLEISNVKRYYKHAKGVNSLSLIYFRIPETNSGYEWIFEKILRNTDAVVQEGENFVAVLYATNRTGASKLLSGIQEFLNDKPIDIIANYPYDARDAKTLMVKFQDDIKEQYGVVMECLNVDEKLSIYED